MKEYPHSAYFAQANMPLADYYLAQKDFEKALETLQKVNQYQLSRKENTQYIMKLGYAKFMTGDSKGAIEALARLDGLPVDSEILREEVEIIRESISQEHVGASGNPFAMTQNRHLHRTLLAMAVNMLAQMTGVNIISFYSKHLRLLRHPVPHYQRLPSNLAIPLRNPRHLPHRSLRPT